MPRVPIAVASPIEPRLPSQDKDCRLINCYAEQQAEGTQVVKRPGLTQHSTVTAGCAQLITVMGDGDLITVVGGTGQATGTFVNAASWLQVDDSMGIGARDTHGFLLFNSAFYIFNGEQTGSPNFYRDVWKSTNDGVTWTQVSTTSTGYYRYSFGYCVHNSAMYIAGGIGNPSSASGVGNTVLNDVWYSNADGSSWTQATAAAAWAARSHTQLVSDGSVLYIIGGFDLSSVPLNDVWKSTDNGANWSQVLANTASPGSSQFAQRGYHQALYFQGKLWVIGGGGTGSTQYNDVWSSADGGLTWIQVTAAASWVARVNHIAWTADSKLWVAGGVDQSVPIQLNDIWSSTTGATWTAARASTADPFSVTSLTRSGSVATVTTSLAHDLTVGINALVSGAVQIEYNGNFTVVSVPTSTSFTYTVTGTPATPATGTIRASACWPRITRARGIYSGSRLWVAGGVFSAAAQDILWKSGQTISNTFAVTTTTACVPIDSLDVSSTATLGDNGQFWKTTEQAWVFDGATLTPVSDPDYPTTTVRGVAFLNDYVFVMTPLGAIHNSDVRAPLAWRATNVIQANSFPDGAVAIARQLQYIVAFKTTSIQFFYINSAATLTESALLPYLNSTLRVGCAAGGSVVSSDNTLFFISQSQQRGRSVMRLDGTTPAKVSNEWVDRILNADDLVDLTGYCVKAAGHWWYIINLPTSDITLVFDAITGVWHRWSSLYADTAKSVSSLTYDTTTALATVTFGTAQVIADGDVVVIAGATPSAYNGTVIFRGSAGTVYTYMPLSVPASTPATGTITATPYLETNFRGAFYANNGTFDLVLGVSDGIIYKIDPTAGDDAGIPINMDARTPEFDGGSFREKFMGELDVVADKPSGTLYVRHSDDDYVTYSNYRAVSLSARRSRMLARPARFVRRAFQLRYTDNTTLRVNRIDADVEPGTF